MNNVNYSYSNTNNQNYMGNNNQNQFINKTTYNMPNLNKEKL